MVLEGWGYLDIYRSGLIQPRHPPFLPFPPQPWSTYTKLRKGLMTPDMILLFLADLSPTEAVEISCCGRGAHIYQWSNERWDNDTGHLWIFKGRVVTKRPGCEGGHSLVVDRLFFCRRGSMNLLSNRHLHRKDEHIPIKTSIRRFPDEPGRNMQHE